MGAWLLNFLPQNSNALLNVVVLRDESSKVLDRIESVAPGRIIAKNIWHSVLPELYNDWPRNLVDRFARSTSQGNLLSQECLEKTLAQADVLLAGHPYPKRLLSRMPQLRWAHWAFAGISNLNESDFWGSSTVCTSSRGFSGALPIAESALGAIFMFTRQLQVAVQQTAKMEFDASRYNPVLTAGKTLGIVGLGGIGSQLARLSKLVGMRVLATRLSAKQRTDKVESVDMLYPTLEMNSMLAQCDFVVISAMWTKDTEKLMNKEAFNSMKENSFIINVARGELIDEEALVSALGSGKIAGAYLDVYRDEFEKPPHSGLVSHPNVFISPHITQRSDENQQFTLDLFCSNLERLMSGKDLVNVIDWDRGY